MKTHYTEFTCDLCNKTERTTVQLVNVEMAGWITLNFPNVDGAGYTHDNFKHLCDECIAKIKDRT
jgi:hypothetical protein